MSIISRYAVLAVVLALGSTASIARGGVVVPDFATGLNLVVESTAFQGEATSPNTYGESWADYPAYLQQPSNADIAALTAAYGNWTFSVSSAASLSGTLTVTTCEATATAGKGGVSLELGYQVAAGDPPIANLHWIQIVTTDAPLGSHQANVPYVDTKPPPEYNGPALPFYYTPDEDMKSANAYGFSDYPGRYWPTQLPSPNTNTLDWSADLLLASWDGTFGANGGGTVTIYGGITWGFGLYEFPLPPDGPDVIGMSAAPEPGSLTLLGLGAGLLGLAKVVRRHCGRWLSRRRLLVVGGSGAIALLLTVVSLAVVVDRSQRVTTRSEPKSCQLELRLPKESFKPGEPIPMDFEYINRSDHQATIWVSSFCLNHLLEVVDERGHNPPLSPPGHECQQRYSPMGERDRNYPVRLAPGERYRPSSVRLDRFYQLAPGAYRLRVTYEDGSDERDHLKCISNWANLRITPRAGKRGRG